MAFKDTLAAMAKKHKLSNDDISGMMGVSSNHVYRYLKGEAEPKWSKVLLLLKGLGYDLKITKEGEKDNC